MARSFYTLFCFGLGLLFRQASLFLSLLHRLVRKVLRTNLLILPLYASILFISSLAQATSPPPNPPGADGKQPPRLKTNSEAPFTAEVEMWAKIKDSSNPADYKDFLKVFPDGEYAAAARLSILRLDRTSQGAPNLEIEEIELWEKSLLKKNCEGFSNYISRFPDRVFEEVAYERLVESYSYERCAEFAPSLLYAVFKAGTAKANKTAIYAASQTGLAIMHLRGDLVKRDPEAALVLLQAAQTSGGSEASYQLARLYRSGTAVPKDFAKMKEALIKAASRGHVRASLELAQAYDSGAEIQQNQAEASVWYRKAADLGSAVAQTVFARRLLDGKGIAINPTEAARYYLMAAKQGNAEAIADLAWMYENGTGIEADRPFALSLYRYIAKRGNGYGMFKTAWMLEKGLGTPAEEEEAMSWYLKAAATGNAQAMVRLGDAYENGVLSQKISMPEALKWYLKAAELGATVAQFKAAYFYQNGIGTSVDYGQAYDWHLKAATQKYSLSYIGLGQLYEGGLGLDADPGLAYAYYVLASESHKDLTRNDIARLEATLTKEQRARADKLLSSVDSAAKKP